MPEKFLAKRTVVRISKKTGEADTIEILASNFRIINTGASDASVAACDLIITKFMNKPIPVSGWDFFDLMANISIFNDILTTKNQEYDFFWPHMEPYSFDSEPH